MAVAAPALSEERSSKKISSWSAWMQNEMQDASRVIARSPWPTRKGRSDAGCSFSPLHLSSGATRGVPHHSRSDADPAEVGEGR